MATHSWNLGVSHFDEDCGADIEVGISSKDGAGIIVVVVVVVGGGSVVWFAKWFGVGLGVGELFKHDWAVVGMFVGDEGLGGFCTRMKNGLRHPYLDKGLRDAIAGSRSCV